jgi:peptidoglycan/xylan/chitin deacetylase (PgdA/CDA1 family)
MSSLKGKLIADLSLDLDNKWSYLKTRGDNSWRDFPTYLPQVVPNVLQILDELQLKITFFVVGQDAVLAVNRESLQAIAAAGHELGNHSFHHEPWLQRYSNQQLKEEIDRAEEAIGRFASNSLRGFRGPGYSLSVDLLKQLMSRGYDYDASTLPTFIGPVARFYYFLRADLNQQQLEDRQQLFGTLADGLRPLRPYRWQDDLSVFPESTPPLRTNDFWEIPVTTLPLFRVPFHFSYLLYLAQISSRLADTYFRYALFCCRTVGLGPSLLLHPLDFLGGDEVSGLDFFPAMQLHGQYKRELIGKWLKQLHAHFQLGTMSERVDWLRAHQPNTRTVALSRFARSSESGRPAP